MAKDKTNKLSIYLIKEEYSSPDDIFRDQGQLEHSEIANIGGFYYGKPHISEPAWVENFFGSSFNNIHDEEGKEGKNKIFTATSKAALVMSVEDRTFVLTFGYGHTLLEPGVWEERFGLKTALGMIDSERLRQIGKKNMSIIPKLSKEQVTKDGTTDNFNIDIEQDLIQEITGKVTDKQFGESVTGRDALSLSVKINASNVKDFLVKCYEKYKSDDYKKTFPWIDHISEIKDPKTVEMLDNDMVEKIKNINEQSSTVWMAIPEIIPWADVDEFKFGRQSFGDDIDLPGYLKFIPDEDKKDLSPEILKKHTVRYISASSNVSSRRWKIYNCLYCEISIDEKMYILSNGKWYQIENDFSKQIFSSFNRLQERRPGIKLPERKPDEHENKYNQRVEEETEGICNMDRKTIAYGGANQKIEFCDLYTKNKKIIHVKRYGASSVLSHLFAQGLVSGEAFLDKEFREKVNEKLPNSHKPELDSSKKLDPSDYEIIFAIISKHDGELNIPFFSKVSMRNAVKTLENFGYSVSLMKISTSKEKDIEN